jgi:cell division protein FtsB
MPNSARAAWIDAWEGASTPSPIEHRGAVREARAARDSREPLGAREAWGLERARSARHEERQATRAGSSRSSDRRASARRRRRIDTRGRQTVPVLPVRGCAPRALSICDYDWEAAARKRPARDEYERVILHQERDATYWPRSTGSRDGEAATRQQSARNHADDAAARVRSTRYYGTEATARLPEPWPDAQRLTARPSLRVVRRHKPRWRLGLLAVTFAVLLVGTAVVAPVMMSSIVAGVETAVGQAEADQEQLAAETAALAAQISTLSSPQRVADEAAALGLAPAQDVSYMPADSGMAGMMASEGETTVAGR